MEITNATRSVTCCFFSGSKNYTESTPSCCHCSPERCLFHSLLHVTNCPANAAITWPRNSCHAAPTILAVLGTEERLSQSRLEDIVDCFYPLPPKRICSSPLFQRNCPFHERLNQPASLTSTYTHRSLYENFLEMTEDSFKLLGYGVRTHLMIPLLGEKTNQLANH